MEATEVLKTYLLQAVKDKEAALETARRLSAALEGMKGELDQHRNVISQFVNEKIQTEAKLLMNRDISEHNRVELEGENTVDVHHLPEQLAEAKAIMDAQKKTIAELFDENRTLRALTQEQEKTVLENANLRRENEDLKHKIDAMGGEDVALLADFLKVNRIDCQFTRLSSQTSYEQGFSWPFSGLDPRGSIETF